MEFETFYLCAGCCKDQYLKNYVAKDAAHLEACTICKKKGKVKFIGDDEKLVTFCRFLIRYHFAEYEYNSHWGGENLPELFYKENPIIYHQFSDLKKREEEIEQFLYTLFDLSKLDSESTINLYSGHDDTGRGLFTRAIKDEKSKAWKYYKKNLLRTNYFLSEEGAKKMLVPFLSELKTSLPSGRTYFRARIGYDERDEELTMVTVRKKVAYVNDKLGAPPIAKAIAGRANRAGVSYLYLASDQETALGEIRPHPGHYVSLGSFINKSELNIADLRFIDLVKYFNDPDNLNTFKLLRDLSEELSFPVLPEENGSYLVTQFICDIIRQLGFDGILFRSSVSQGHNLVIFNSTTFEFEPASEQLIKVLSVHFTFKNVEYDTNSFLERLIEK